MLQTYTNITNKQIIPYTLHYAYLVLHMHAYKRIQSIIYIYYMK